MLKRHVQHVRQLARNAECSRTKVLQQLKSKIEVQKRQTDSPGATSSNSASTRLTDSPGAPSITISSPSNASSPDVLVVEADPHRPNVLDASSPDVPPAKRLRPSRTGHLAASAPADHDIEALEAGLQGVTVSHVAQAALAAAVPAPKLGDIMALPAYDREMPPNFASELKEVFIRLPAECLPQPNAKTTGKANYTVYSSDGRQAIQVQLANKVFFLARKDGVKWNKATMGSSNVCWSNYSSIEEAWQAALSKVGPW